MFYDYHIANYADVPHIAVELLDSGSSVIERILDIYDVRNVDLAEKICDWLNGKQQLTTDGASQ